MKSSKTRGFTLIELLAIIVILAIIAVITVPIILNVIENSRKGAAVDSAYGYKDAIEKYYLTELSKDSDFDLESGDYSVNDVGIISQSGTLHTIPTSGIVPSEGSISIENNTVKTACLVIDEYKIELQDGKFTINGKGECEKTYTKYDDGDVIYFNPYDPNHTDKSGKECTLEEYTANTDASKTGNNKGCMKFYAFLDSEDLKTVNLILDHNTTATVAWNSIDKVDNNYNNYTNSKGPSAATGQLLDKLNEATQYWTGVETPNPISYTPSKMYDDKDPYTITYSNYKARLISAEEVAQITGADKETSFGDNGWTLSDSYFYFGSLSPTGYSSQTDTQKARQRELGWLFDRTNSSCTSNGCANNATGDNISSMLGYWTSSPSASSYNNAWSVVHYGELHSNLIHGTTSYGVRPVITVSKSNLSQ